MEVFYTTTNIRTSIGAEAVKGTVKGTTHNTTRAMVRGTVTGVLLTLSLLGCRTTADDRPTPVSSPAVETPSTPLTTPDQVAKAPLPKPSDKPIVKPSVAKQTEAALYRQQGLEYRAQGRYDKAIAALKNSVRSDPSNLSGQVILGWTLHLDEQGAVAIDVLERALVQDGEHVPALNALGIVYLVNGQLDQAVDNHTRAVALEPDNEIAYYNLSLAYHRLERYGDAIANAQQAADLEPDNPHPLVALAMAHWDNQDTAAAQQAYQQAIDLDPSYQASWHLGHLQQAGFSPEQIETTENVRQAM